MKKILVNQPEKNKQVMTTLLEEMGESESFFLSVAFFNLQGIQCLKTVLSDLAHRNIKGRLLTGTYNDFNQKEDFLELLKLKNLEVRISSEKNFHPKMYLFRKGNDQSSLIAGSSNLTNAALKSNIEFNMLYTCSEDDERYTETTEWMEHLWNQAENLTEEWLENYNPKIEKSFQTVEDTDEYVVKDAFVERITPNAMQEEALKNIQAFRVAGKRRGLLISATGTGKTYLAAFDIERLKPKRLLFLAHRETLLNQAKNTFSKLMPEIEKGIYSGGKKEMHAKYLFATVQSLSKSLNEFAKDAFDAIIIDESHHVKGSTYQSILQHFEPKWLMGMTATPERSDDYDVFELFDHNIVYEIRLQDAMDADLLVPFNYFGVTEIDEVQVKADISILTSDIRLQHLVNRIHYYCPSHETPKGIVFTSSVEEAKVLAEKFSQMGEPSAFLWAQSNEFERELRIRDLEDGKLHYLFVRDLFNEGIDIPSVNRVIMLRQTESSIVFIQQLGRGLRKFPGKEATTVLDFIGNYGNNYMIPIALTGDHSLDKRHYLKNLTTSTMKVNIALEEIPKERIIRSIQSAQLNSAKIFRESFQYLRAKFGRIPKLFEFMDEHQVDPWRLALYKKDYSSFLEWMGEEVAEFTVYEKKVLHFLSKQILKGVRKYEIELLERLIEGQEIRCDGENVVQQHSIRVLSLDFFTEQDRVSYGELPLVLVERERICLSKEFQQSLENEAFLAQVEDILLTAKRRNEQYGKSDQLVVGSAYSYTDVCRLLNWKKDERATIGGYRTRKKVTPIFVNLDKEEDAIQYSDKFLSKKKFSWHSRKRRSVHSEEIQKILDKENVNHLFVRKWDEEKGVDFIYLGKANVLDYKNETLEDAPIVNLEFVLETEVEENLYKYLKA